MAARLAVELRRQRPWGLPQAKEALNNSLPRSWKKTQSTSRPTPVGAERFPSTTTSSTNGTPYLRPTRRSSMRAPGARKRQSMSPTGGRRMKHGNPSAAQVSILSFCRKAMRRRDAGLRVPEDPVCDEGDSNPPGIIAVEVAEVRQGPGDQVEDLAVRPSGWRARKLRDVVPPGLDDADDLPFKDRVEDKDRVHIQMSACAVQAEFSDPLRAGGQKDDLISAIVRDHPVLTGDATEFHDADATA